MAAARTSFDLSAAAMRRASRSDFVDDPTVVRLSLRKCYHSVRTSDRRCQRKPPPELRAGSRALGSVGRRVQRDRAARLRALGRDHPREQAAGGLKRGFSSPRSALRRACSPFFFNASPTTEIYTLSLHDARPRTATSPARAP